MKSYAKLTPEGMRDVPFEGTAIERIVEGEIQHLFAVQGYREVHTPGLEYFDVFGATDRYFPQEKLYKLTDPSGRIIVLRPDSTLPIARMVATKLANEPLPLRMCYSQSIFRHLGAHHGVAHEKRQMGVELIGQAEGEADLEMLVLACQVFDRLGFEDFRLEIGHVGIFQGLIETLNLSETEEDAIRQSIEDKNYDLLKQLLAPYGDRAEVKVLLELPRFFGHRDDVEARAKALANFPGKVGRSFKILCQLQERLAEMGYGDKVIFDLGLVASPGYYTGIMFRGYIGGAAGAVLSGGRYDNLFADFDYDVEAIGFGFQVDVVAALILEERNVVDKRIPLLFVENEQWLPEALQWRYQQGIVCELTFAKSLEEAREEGRQKQVEGIYLYRPDGVSWEEVAQ